MVKNVASAMESFSKSGPEPKLASAELSTNYVTPGDSEFLLQDFQWLVSSMGITRKFRAHL